ncbi:hypothetical protein [Myxosarcina sp. GI1]|uniref:hypothetical protein n=1 Tax=Myxosarcina sp. GI1 TaxID=1541065 RepID=UPI000561A58D|nr:hypothetical protein [Myxosarcina sp. GI1]
MKLANPLHYPLAVCAGGITLIIGVRWLRLPNPIVLPTAIAIATVVSLPLQHKENSKVEIDNPALAREIYSVRQQAKLLLTKAEELRREAQQTLTASTQLELLSTVEYTCDRLKELPAKIDHLTKKLQGSDSLFSPKELSAQIAEVRAKQQNSPDLAKEQLKQLANSLESNLKLARQGQDARQAQVVALNTLVIESAGILQQLQNRLRTSNLNDAEEIEELQGLSEELKSMQESVGLLITS